MTYCTTAQNTGRNSRQSVVQRLLARGTHQSFFYVLLTMHFSIFILVINQFDAHNFVLQ